MRPLSTLLRFFVKSRLWRGILDYQKQTQTKNCEKIREGEIRAIAKGSVQRAV
ncbi:hypothetical protein IAD21_05375 [Abditibacteriota bacterium]|nr:hypothetical protein IAD21_05375 [Abditibacteriota bacterium]